MEQPTGECANCPVLPSSYLACLLSPGKMFLVGLTGGIASGKSSVIQVFQQLGCAVIDVDVIARHGECTAASPVLPSLDSVFLECPGLRLPWRFFCLFFILLTIQSS